MVSNIFYFYPYLGKISNLTNIFQMGSNHHLVFFWCLKLGWKKNPERILNPPSPKKSPLHRRSNTENLAGKPKEHAELCSMYARLFLRKLIEEYITEDCYSKPTVMCVLNSKMLEQCFHCKHPSQWFPKGEQESENFIFSADKGTAPKLEFDFKKVSSWFCCRGFRWIWTLRSFG